MIATCHRDHQEYCFVVRPSIGSRKIDLVGTQFSNQISAMAFVSDDIVFIKLKNGRCLTFSSNGLIRRIKYSGYIEEEGERCIELMSRRDTVLINESMITSTSKNLVFEIKTEDADTEANGRYFIVRFDDNGKP